MNYETHDVAVPGGMLRVGSWRTDGPTERVILAVHGITSTHRAWDLVVPHLPPGILLVAPDLRGRGRSGSLPGPSGLPVHAQDCWAALDALTGGRCDLVVGHSMGAFVSVLVAAQRPDSVPALVLVDGGIPFTLPAGVDLPTAMAASLGPAVARLTMTFPSQAAYRDYWRAHPAFTGLWTDVIADYIDYDLDPHGPPFRPACSAGLVATDYPDMYAGGPVERAWPDLTQPVAFLRAPRGLMDEPGGMYPVDDLRAWMAAHPDVTWTDVEDTNHYSIVLGDPGAAAVAAALTATG